MPQSRLNRPEVSQIYFALVWLVCSKRLEKRGAGGRTRTDMSVTSPDFESGAYTNFATPASRAEIIRPLRLRCNTPDRG
jgi:hypothetical protein